MSEFKSEISYVLSEEGGEVMLFRLPTTVVPKVGEHIYLNNKCDYELMEATYSQYDWYKDERLRRTLLRPIKESVEGKFEIFSVTRYIDNYHYPIGMSALVAPEHPSAGNIEGEQKIPQTKYVETFEVFIKKVDE
jgi:hypothetical protein